jgi:hypothetical protein
LGANKPLATGSNSDSLLVLDPQTREWITMRVPYPLGFYSRGMDGRIDDPNAGWKGRALYANYGTHFVWHIEGGKGTKGKAGQIPASSPIRSRDELTIQPLWRHAHDTCTRCDTRRRARLVCSSLAQTGGGRLQISWIDVEGGASTLFVAPNGQSLLFDTGFPATTTATRSASPPQRKRCG